MLQPEVFMKETSGKYNIRYLGFESMADGGRRLDFSITTPGQPPRRARFEIPAGAFSGTNRVTFQESAALCYEKLRNVVGQGNDGDGLLEFKVTEMDIEEFRPRGRRAAAKNKV